MSSNFQELIDKSVEESRLRIAQTAGHLATAHQSFANEYLLNVANQALYMFGSTIPVKDFEVEFDGLKAHLMSALTERNDGAEQP